MKTSRNSPCSCNSSKKYKNCCGKVSSSSQPDLELGKTKLEPGSYKTPNGYFPAIMCYCSNSPDYCLINDIITFQEEHESVQLANKNLNQALQLKESSNNQIDIANALKEFGYKNLENYQVA